MPNSELKSLIKKVDIMYDRLEAHLIEGTGVHTNIEWLKRYTWVTLGTSLTTLGTLVVYLLVKR